MRIAATFAVTLLVFAASLTWAAPVGQPDLAVGQIWSVRGEPPTTTEVVIGRIEPWAKGLVAVSVRIIHIPTENGEISVGHAPFEKTALIGSLDRLLATNATLPASFEDGYAQWKAASGGIYTISVPAAVTAMFATVKAPPSPPPSSNSP